MRPEPTETFRKPWYHHAARLHAPTLGVLSGTVNSDVCIVGGGFTGLSAALELARAGYKVCVLEAGPMMAYDASGRNGGHIQRGWAKPPGWLAASYGDDIAKAMLEMSLEGIALIHQRIKEHAIDCDIHTGYLNAAMTKRHLREFAAEIADWDRFGHGGLTMVDQPDMASYIRSPLYIGGLHDDRSGHFNPYDYAQGIAQAAQHYGAQLYSDTVVTDIDYSDTTSAIVKTAAGATVKATYVIVAGAIDLPQMKKPLAKSITARAHMIATAPLGDALVELLPRNVAVADANFVLTYFRRTHDNRLLLGGNCNYSGHDFGHEEKDLRQRLAAIFPSLANVRIDHCWHGPLDMTINRLPDVGWLAPHVLYAHGFAGYGVVAANLMGRLLAEAVRGTAERFDLYTRIKHVPFVGGTLAKRPLFMLGMLWYQLRDHLQRH